MDAYSMNDVSRTCDLVGAAHLSDEPLVVFDGEDECLVAMRPAVFERILFDSSLLNRGERESLRL